MIMNDDKALLRTMIWLVAALTVVGALAWQLSTYYYADDFAYMRLLETPSQADFLSCRGPMNSSMTDVWNSIMNHYVAVNGRLANIIVYIMLLLPLWIVKAVAGLTMSALFFLITFCCWRYCRSIMARLMAISVSAFLFWTAFPWYDSFQSYAFQTNYVLPSVFVLLYVIAWERVGRVSFSAFVALTFFAVFVGWMHEGFTCPLIAASLFSLVFDKYYRKRRVWLVVALVVGLVFSMSGASMARATLSLGRGGSFGYASVLTRMSTQLWVVWLATFSFIIFYVRRREFWSTSVFRLLLMLMVGAWTAVLQAFVLQVVYRALWPAELFGVVSLVIIVADRFPPGSMRCRKALLALYGVLSVGYLLWLVSLFVWQNRFASEQKYMMDYLRKSDKSVNVAFLDRTFEREAPFWLMGMTSQPFEGSGINNYLFASAAGVDGGVFITLSESYSDTPYEKWPDIDGTAGIKGYDRTLVSRHRYECDFRIYTGASYPSETPADKAVSALRSIAGAPMYADVSPMIWTLRMPDRSTLYLYQLPPLPRSMENRIIIRVDTIADE